MPANTEADHSASSVLSTGFKTAFPTRKLCP